MKAKIDGLQVLKGGQGKAVIYIDNAAMKDALDLNEQDVEVSLASPQAAPAPLSRDELREAYRKARREADAAFNALFRWEQEVCGGIPEEEPGVPGPMGVFDFPEAKTEDPEPEPSPYNSDPHER